MGPLQRAPGLLPTAFSQDPPRIRRRERTSLVKNRMREICTSGSVRGGGGNVPTYSAELAHEEVMKIKMQVPANIGIVEFLWYRDSQPDIEPLRFGSAAIGCLHDAGTATGTDDKAPLLAIELLRPGR